MKPFIFIAFLLILSSQSIAQKIISEKGEVKELKEVNPQYTQIVFQGTLNKMKIGIETNQEGFCQFYDDQIRKEMKFNSHAEVMNFMFRNGWVFKQFTQSSNAPASDYIFERKDK